MEPSARQENGIAKKKAAATTEEEKIALDHTCRGWALAFTLLSLSKIIVAMLVLTFHYGPNNPRLRIYVSNLLVGNIFS